MTIDAGTGVDTITGTTGDDTIVISSGDTGITIATADTIADFVTGSTSVDLDSALNSYEEVDGTALANTVAAVVGALTLAGAAAVDGGIVYNIAGSGNSVLFVDEDGDGAASAGDTVVILLGVATAADVAGDDFI